MILNIKKITKIINEASAIGNQNPNAIFVEIAKYITPETAYDKELIETIINNHSGKIIPFPNFMPTHHDNWLFLSSFIFAISRIEWIAKNSIGYIGNFDDVKKISISMQKSYIVDYSNISFDSEEREINFEISKERLDEIDKEIAKMKEDMASIKEKLRMSGLQAIEADDLFKEVVVSAKQIRGDFNKGDKKAAVEKLKKFYEFTKKIGRKSLPFFVAATPALIEMF